jgi:predicted HicB family RNase H-like nuclease
MTCDPLMRFDEWTALGAKLGTYVNASAWWLGDWLAFGQAKYGRRYKSAVALTGLDYQTLRNYAVVSRRFASSRRRADLSFQHHAEVCALPDAEQESWLDRAAAHNWSRNELRRHIRAGHPPATQVSAGRLVVVLDPERERRWREAAQRSERCFEDWVFQALDAAAAEA